MDNPNCNFECTDESFIRDNSRDVFIFTDKIEIIEEDNKNIFILNNIDRIILSTNTTMNIDNVFSVYFDDTHLVINENIQIPISNHSVWINEIKNIENILYITITTNNSSSLMTTEVLNKMKFFPNYSIEITQDVNIDTQQLLFVANLYVQINKTMNRELIYVVKAECTEILFHNIQSILYDLYLLNDFFKFALNEYVHYIEYLHSIFKINKSQLISQYGLHCFDIESGDEIYISLLHLARNKYCLIFDKTIFINNFNIFYIVNDTIEKLEYDSKLCKNIVTLYEANNSPTINKENQLELLDIIKYVRGYLVETNCDNIIYNSLGSIPKIFIDFDNLAEIENNLESI